MATTSPQYHPRRSKAKTTKEYTFSQLIPYIGNKRKLLNLIQEAIKLTNLSNGTFVDLFSGSTVVARCAKQLGFRVLANDWEPYSHQIAVGTIVQNQTPPFTSLGGCENAFRTLNELDPIEGYFALHLCPEDDDNPDHETDRQFFMRKNGMKIDAMRERIEEWRIQQSRTPISLAFWCATLSILIWPFVSGKLDPDTTIWGIKTTYWAFISIICTVFLLVRVYDATWGLRRGPGSITDDEFGYLMAAFTYSVSWVSNTSGVFKGFHRGWGGSNQPALYRICSDIHLEPPIVIDNGQKNIATRQDAGELVHSLSSILGKRPDIVYLDPPYNQHPYGSNYHILNTLVLWDKPELPEKITPGTKAAIRKDWRSERRSAYNHHNQAVSEFEELVSDIDSRFILTSYSTEGNMPVEEVLRILGSRGSVQVVRQEYTRYRVSAQRPSPRPRNIEFVVVVDTEGNPEASSSLSEIVSDLQRRDAAIPESDDETAEGQPPLLHYLPMAEEE